MESFDVLTQDLIDAERRVSAIKFDEYKERFNFEVLKGIQLIDFDNVVERIASRFDFPEDVKQSIIDGKYGSPNLEVLKEFRFNKGETGQAIYGRTLTIKNQDKIDMAYALVVVNFKLSPVQSVRTVSQYFLFWKVSEKRIVTSQHRNLSVQQRDDMNKFFHARSIRGLQDLQRSIDFRNTNGNFMISLII